MSYDILSVLPPKPKPTMAEIEWEDDYTDSDGITLTTGEDLDLGPHIHIRRWESEWEEA
ncbi:hypothetical protein [Corynebacterium accolens]|uniref:hypothetical protein n=1 Tax=Corynebacterium accolens TaxID=38284 RepID=UPI00254F2B15|nr:hypothetical protein [Corynebacterium accolens]MDK8503692.1 hypothetical protein [Corynebacterium accolens]MDK8661014.1 hypothetical protein [Corynebacterium accolens]